MKRHTYARVSAADFSQMLADLGWPDGSKFAWVYGVPPARVTSWMRGEEDIPPAAFLMIQLLLQLPGAQQLAIDHTTRVAQPTDRERERRQAFEERKRQGGSDGPR